MKDKLKKFFSKLVDILLICVFVAFFIAVVIGCSTHTPYSDEIEGYCKALGYSDYTLIQKTGFKYPDSFICHDGNGDVQFVQLDESID